MYDMLHDNINTNVTPGDASRINMENEYNRITHGCTTWVVNGVIRVAVVGLAPPLMSAPVSNLHRLTMISTPSQPTILLPIKMASQLLKRPLR